MRKMDKKSFGKGLVAGLAMTAMFATSFTVFAAANSNEEETETAAVEAAEENSFEDAKWIRESEDGSYIIISEG